MAPEQIEIPQKDLLGEHSQTNASKAAVLLRICALDATSPGEVNRTTDDTTVEWDSGRGWFQEVVKISNIRYLGLGGFLERRCVVRRPMTMIAARSVRVNSWVGMDVDMWNNIFDPRDRSVTLPHEERLDAIIPSLRELSVSGTVQNNRFMSAS